MKLTSLKIRDKLICRLSGNEGNEFVLRVEEVLGNDAFVTDLPIVSGGVPFRFKEGRSVEFIKTAREGIYYFVAKVTPSSSQNLLEWSLSEKGIQHIQRRSFFRLELSIDVRVKKMRDFFCQESNEQKPSVIDISAGGIRFRSTKNIYSCGDLVFVYLDAIPKVLGSWGEILRIVDNENSSQQEIIVKFVHISETTQENILKYLFSKERDILKYKK